MLGAIVWWFATLFPFDLSEGAIGTPIKRLGNDLPLLIQKAEASCQTTLDKYNHALREGTFEHCAPSSRAGILSSGKAQLLDFIKSIDEILDVFSANCPDEVSDWRRRYYNACHDRRNAIATFLDDIVEQGNLDIAGLKISNIHPKWHSLSFIFIFIISAMTLGSQRRRVLRILEHSSRLYIRKTTTLEATRDFFPNSLPWWVWPVPHWTFGDEQPSLRDLLAKHSGYRRIPLTLLFIMLILFLIFWNSFGVQILVSNFQVTEYQQTLAELPNQSFSVTGGAPTDLALLGGLVALAIAVFCWLPRRACDVSEGSARPQSPRRREVIAQGIGWVSFIGVAAIVTPALVDRRISSKLFDDWSRERSRGGMGMEATISKGSPRFRRKAQVAQSNHPVGWYIHRRGERQPQWIGHFVRPEYKIVRPAHPDPGRKVSESIRPAGTIGGAGTLREEEIKRLGPLRSGDLPPFSSGERPRLNALFYSEGIEYLALEMWRAGAKIDAIAVLHLGMSYAWRPIPGRRLNVRLYDLLAGLLVRTGREDQLEPLIAQLRDAIGRSQVDDKRLGDRINRWSERDGKWRRGWRPDQVRRWNGIDI